MLGVELERNRIGEHAAVVGKVVQFPCCIPRAPPGTIERPSAVCPCVQLVNMCEMAAKAIAGTLFLTPGITHYCQLGVSASLCRFGPQPLTNAKPRRVVAFPDRRSACELIHGANGKRVRRVDDPENSGRKTV